MKKSFFQFGKKQEESLFSKEKVFCIGLNKTGTTSLEKTLADFGYKMGDQYRGEMLLKEYAARNFAPIVEFCHSADAFQDLPFSVPFTYLILDHYFPNARFILTVRDSAEQWYDSLVKFHSKIFGNGAVPTKADLMNAEYRYKGFAWDANRFMFDTPEDDLYRKPDMISYYEVHNASVREYFRTKRNFLEINLAEKTAYKELCHFLGKTPAGDDFPWLNKT